MQFEYQPLVSFDPASGAPQMILRPEIPIVIYGPRLSVYHNALVDTGADNTIFPKSLADRIGLSLQRTNGPPAKSFGGHVLPTFFGEVRLRLETADDVCEWTATVLFFDFSTDEDETLILGHAGFLDYFTATFDGQECVLTLTPNDDLPAA